MERDLSLASPRHDLAARSSRLAQATLGMPLSFAVIECPTSLGVEQISSGDDDITVAGRIETVYRVVEKTKVRVSGSEGSSLTLQRLPEVST